MRGSVRGNAPASAVQPAHALLDELLDLGPLLGGQHVANGAHHEGAFGDQFRHQIALNRSHRVDCRLVERFATHQIAQFLAILAQRLAVIVQRRQGGFDDGSNGRALRILEIQPVGQTFDHALHARAFRAVPATLAVGEGQAPGGRQSGAEQCGKQNFA